MRHRPTGFTVAILVTIAVASWLAILFPILCVVYAGILFAMLGVWLMTRKERKKRRQQAKQQAAYYAYHHSRIAGGPSWTK